MGYYFYVIESGEAQYFGITKDLKDRLSRHNYGQNRSTKHRKNWKLVYFEEHDTLSKAKLRESAVKRRKQKFCPQRDVAQPG